MMEDIIVQRMDDLFQSVEKLIDDGSASIQELESELIGLEHIVKVADLAGVLSPVNLSRYRVMIKILRQRLNDRLVREQNRRIFFRDFNAHLIAFAHVHRSVVLGRVKNLHDVSLCLHRSLRASIRQAFDSGMISRSEKVELSGRIDRAIGMEVIRHA